MTERVQRGGWMRAHPRLVDAGLVALVAVPGLVLLVVYRGYPGVDDVVAYREADLPGFLLVLALAVPLWWRRSCPVASAVTVAAVALVLGLASYAAPLAGVAMLLAAYAAGAYARFRRGLLALLATGLSSTLYLVLLGRSYADLPGTDPASVLVNLFSFVGAWALGRGVRNRRLYTDQLVDRAARLERTRTAEVRAALAEERARIARELHDVVAHHVSVMTVQAAAARRTIDRDPARSAEAMAAVEHTGRDALAEMRRIVGVLRDAQGGGDGRAGGAREPQPGLGDLPELTAQLAEAGLPVSVEVVGERPQLAPGVDLAAFRVVQEALTNSLKHAGPTRATVTVEYRPDEVRVRVGDDGRGLASRLEDRAPGHGLLGMRERVGLYGGSVHAGPRDGGGFEVRAALPVNQETT